MAKLKLVNCLAINEKLTKKLRAEIISEEARFMCSDTLDWVNERYKKKFLAGLSFPKLKGEKLDKKLVRVSIFLKEHGYDVEIVESYRCTCIVNMNPFEIANNLIKIVRGKHPE